MDRLLEREAMAGVLRREASEFRRERLKNFSLLLGTILVCLVLGELAARIALPGPLPWLWPQTAYEKSPSLGFRLRPNQSAYTADKTVLTNSMGLRGPETTWQKPAGTQRILVLGDSIAFGFGVRYEDTFGSKLAELLNQSEATRSYEVINAGVPSFNTIQEVTYFREEGIRLQPDMVVVALYWNDISDKAGVGVDSQGRLVDDTTDKEPGWSSRWLATKEGYWLRNLTKSSRLLYFVGDRTRFLFSGSTQSDRHARMQKAVLTGSSDGHVDTGWKSIEQGLRELAQLCRSNNIRLLVAILPMPQVLDQEYPNARYPAMAKELCERQDVDYVDCGLSLKNHYRGHASLFIPYDGDHPNEEGHRLIAQCVYTSLDKAASR